MTNTHPDSWCKGRSLSRCGIPEIGLHIRKEFGVLFGCARDDNRGVGFTLPIARRRKISPGCCQVVVVFQAVGRFLGSLITSFSVS